MTPHLLVASSHCQNVIDQISVASVAASLQHDMVTRSIPAGAIIPSLFCRTRRNRNFCPKITCPGPRRIAVAPLLRVRIVGTKREGAPPMTAVGLPAFSSALARQPCWPTSAISWPPAAARWPATSLDCPSRPTSTPRPGRPRSESPPDLALALCRRLHDTGRFVPIIHLSEPAHAQARLAAYEAGADVCLPPPLRTRRATRAGAGPKLAHQGAARSAPRLAPRRPSRSTGGCGRLHRHSTASWS